MLLPELVFALLAAEAALSTAASMLRSMPFAHGLDHWILLFCDNSGVVGVLKRGHSSSWPADVILQR